MVRASANQFARILDQGKCYLLRHFNLAETSQELSGFLSLIGANLYAAPASPNTGPSERCRVVPNISRRKAMMKSSALCKAILAGASALVLGAAMASSGTCSRCDAGPV